jgi:hypothetical protein
VGSKRIFTLFKTVARCYVEQVDCLIIDPFYRYGAGFKQKVIMSKSILDQKSILALSPESLKRALDMGARACLPKEKLGEMGPFHGGFII